MIGRLGQALVLALALVLMPSIASAVFTGNSIASLTVGTATLAAPTALSGTYECTRGGFLGLREGMKVTVTSVAADRPGSSFTYTVSRDGQDQASETKGSFPAVVDTGLLSVDWKASSWTLTVSQNVGLWSSPVLSQELSCKFGNGHSHTL